MISQFQVVLIKPFWFFLGGRVGGGKNPKSVVFFSLFDWAAVQLSFSDVIPEIKTLKLVIKVDRVEQFSTMELFLMF